MTRKDNHCHFCNHTYFFMMTKYKLAEWGGGCGHNINQVDVPSIWTMLSYKPRKSVSVATLIPGSRPLLAPAPLPCQPACGALWLASWRHGSVSAAAQDYKVLVQRCGHLVAAVFVYGSRRGDHVVMWYYATRTASFFSSSRPLPPACSVVPPMT